MGIYAITGASSGIGAAIGRQLKAQGHYVINISRRAAAEDAADVNISADLAMKAERGRVLEALYAAAPDGLDGFVSCSGVGPTQPADVIVSINYFAAREMTEGAYPLVEKKKGVILVVSSNSATLPQLNTELVDIMLNQNDEDAAVAYGNTGGTCQISGVSGIQECYRPLGTPLVRFLGSSRRPHEHHRSRRYAD